MNQQDAHLRSYATQTRPDKSGSDTTSPPKNLTKVDSGMSGSKKISDKFTMLSVTSPAAL